MKAGLKPAEEGSWVLHLPTHLVSCSPTNFPFGYGYKSQSGAWGSPRIIISRTMKIIYPEGNGKFRGRTLTRVCKLPGGASKTPRIMPDCETTEFIFLAENSCYRGQTLWHCTLLRSVYSSNPVLFRIHYYMTSGAVTRDPILEQDPPLHFLIPLLERHSATNQGQMFGPFKPTCRETQKDSFWIWLWWKILVFD